MRRITILAILAILASLAVLAIPSTAQAALAPPYPTDSPNVPSLGFDSDLDEDGVIEVCPNPTRATYVTEAIANINATTSTLPGADPVIELTSSGTAWCELEVVNKGGTGAEYYAQVRFDLHPDEMQVSDRFGQLPTDGQRGATIRHEFMHSFGEAHPINNFGYFCDNAVVSTFEKCRDIGNPRRTSYGPEDAAVEFLRWDKLGSQPVEDGVEGPYPIPNKCWYSTATDDADNDGVCDHYGPPSGAPAQADRSSLALEQGGRPVETVRVKEARPE